MKTKKCGVFENIVVVNGSGGHLDFCLEITKWTFLVKTHNMV